MKAGRIILAALCGLISAPTVAQEQYVLQMSYAAGEQRRMHVTFTGVGTLTIQGPGVPNQPTGSRAWPCANDAKLC